MPFIANTPESLVARTDSKNPATTCRGITSGGRPCRRPLPASDIASLKGSRRRGKLRTDDPRDERLYCWQHKEQARMSTQSSPGPKVSSQPILEERTSLDTLADRLGLLSVASANGDGIQNNTSTSMPPYLGKPSQSKSNCSCCCFQVPFDEAPVPPPRPRPQPAQPALSSSGKSQRKPGDQHHGPRQSLPAHMQHLHRTPHLSLIPPSASPETASALLDELAKPISQTDEPGYIYMFWLTPESQPASPAEEARSLLAPSSSQRHVSDVLASFSLAEAGSIRGLTSSNGSSSHGGRKSILLKIGRANNVQRRLNEWKRQCGYNLSLIRYYPYLPSSASGPGNAAVPRKMPHSHKVERLIHIELAGAGLRVADAEKCEACGREHREWFHVEATRKAVMKVDDTIRRWSDWDEGRL